MTLHTLPLRQALSLFSNGEMGGYIRVNVFSDLYYCGHWLEKMKVTVVLLLASLIGAYMGQQQGFDSEEIEGEAPNEMEARDDEELHTPNLENEVEGSNNTAVPGIQPLGFCYYKPNCEEYHGPEPVTYYNCCSVVTETRSWKAVVPGSKCVNCPC